MSALDKLVSTFLASEKGRYVNALTIMETPDGRVQITICNGDIIHHAYSVADDVEDAAHDLHKKVEALLTPKPRRRRLF